MIPLAATTATITLERCMNSPYRRPDDLLSTGRNSASLKLGRNGAEPHHPRVKSR
jgi:hypothetical protein